MSFRQDPFVRPVIRDIIRDLVRPVFGISGAVANWILPFLQLGQTEGTSTADNKTAQVWLNDTNLYGVELTADLFQDNTGGVEISNASGLMTLTGANTIQEGYSRYPTSTDGHAYNIILDVNVSGGVVMAFVGDSNRASAITLSPGVNSIVQKRSGDNFVYVGIVSGTVTGTVEIVSDNGVSPLTLVEIPDSSDIGIQNGLQYDSTAKTYSFTLSDGTSVAKLITPTPQTTNGSVPTLDPLVDRTNGATVSAGDDRRALSSDGLNCWIEYQVGGTLAGSLPSFSITDIGGTTPIADGAAATFLVKSLHTATGLFSGLAQNQHLATPETPANQTTGSLGTGTYILFMNGTGSVSATDNTATSDAAGQSASEGSPLVITVSGAGTIDMVVTGSVDIFNLQDGAVVTPYIITTPRSETISQTPIGKTKLTPEAGYGVIVATPDRAGQVNGYLIGSRVDGSNFTAVYITSSTNVRLRKNGVLLNKNYTHAADVSFVVVYGYNSSTGSKLAVGNLGSVLPTPSSNSDTSLAQLSSILESGSFDNQVQFQGETIFNGTFDSWGEAVDFIRENNWADVSNL